MQKCDKPWMTSSINSAIASVRKLVMKAGKIQISISIGVTKFNQVLKLRVRNTM